MSQSKDTKPPPEPENKEGGGIAQGTTRSPADADIERIRPIRPGRADEETSEAGGVD